MSRITKSWRWLREVVIWSSWLAGIGIGFMMLVTCTDVLVRRFGLSVPGAYDMVRLAGGITIAAALPITTAVKGHVAIEHFFHQLSYRNRMIVDSVMRTLQVIAFSFAACGFVQRGQSLLRDGEVTPTLQCPTYWVAWVIAAACALTAVVSLFHLIRPREELL